MAAAITTVMFAATKTMVVAVVAAITEKKKKKEEEEDDELSCREKRVFAFFRFCGNIIPPKRIRRCVIDMKVMVRRRENERELQRSPSITTNATSDKCERTF
ncbi:hypothetical protein PIB30_013049 [Stylosanthes scabra]|uniref:Secreted protein n=1 Tax=Stylosanthes scabra TaxID=79078 RepID=A0ABU6T638_9FABA|nr:hypothetical protein [Stylosanthes scabra]